MPKIKKEKTFEDEEEQEDESFGADLDEEEF
jgi:hypothetical protein